MARRVFQIRFGGLEVRQRNGEAILVPWRLVSQVKGAANLCDARRIWPTLPYSAGLTEAQSRVVRSLRERATRRRLREDRIDLFWRAPWVSFDALIYATVAMTITLPLVPMVLCKSCHSPAVEAAIRSHLHPGFWIASGLLAACVAGSLLFCLAKLGQLALERWRKPRPVAFRATRRGLTVYTDDGHESLYGWNRVTKFADGVLEFDRRLRINVGLGANVPELVPLCRVLSPRPRRLDTYAELWRELRTLLPNAIRCWLLFGLVAAGVVIAVEQDTSQLPRMLATVLVAPLAVLASLAILCSADLLPRWFEKLSRRRRRQRLIVDRRRTPSQIAFPA